MKKNINNFYLITNNSILLFTMSLTVVQNNHDLVEFNKNKYFFRVADIFLENNKKTEYVDYLLKLNEIYGIIQDFSNSTISNVYRERHDDGSVISTINNDLLITIKNLNQKFININLEVFLSI